MNDNKIEIIRANWKRAAKELNFKIVLPFFIDNESEKKEVFAYLPEYGSKNGMIISLIFRPEFLTDHKVENWAKSHNMFCSFINGDSYLNFNVDKFIDALEDWGKFK